jgi:hypothetical protein
VGVSVSLQGRGLRQEQKQIPFGNDRKKSKGKCDGSGAKMRKTKER